MKKSIIYLLAFLPLISIGQGAIDRTKAPKPGPAPEIKVGTPATFTLTNGLKVFVVKNTKLPRVSASLTIDMDGIVEGNKAGMVSMAGSLLRRGTDSLNKAQLDEAIDFLGANISTSSSAVSASSLKGNFAKVFDLMGSIVMKPSFPAAELEKIRNQELNGIQSGKDDPTQISGNVVGKLVYGANHPYGEIETEETVKNVNVDDVKNFFKKYWMPNNAYLVFVGDITVEDAKKLAMKNFGSWKKGMVPKETYSAPAAPAKTYVAIVDRPASVQSIITFATPVQMKPGAPDAIPSSVMNNILGGGFSGRLFANLREKHAFTYGAYSSLNSDRLVGKFSAEASVRNEKTDSSIAEFIHEFNRLRTEMPSEDEVSRMKNYLSGSFARSLENPGTIAGFALNIARYKLPANYYQDYLKNLAAVTPEKVQAMAKEYVKPGNMHIVIVGNAKQIMDGLNKYGEVKYFDIYGNPTTAPEVKKVDAKMTPEIVLQKAVASMGGHNGILAVQDLDLAGTASIMGREISITQKHIFPGAYLFTAGMGGMVLQKELLVAGKYSVSQQGQNSEPDAEDQEEINEKASFFTEAYLLRQPGYTFTMQGIEKLDGKDAYVIAVKSTLGREYNLYYDVTSGFKVKMSSQEDAGPMGKVTVQTYFSDYKMFSGVNIPTKVIIDLGQFKQEITFSEVKVNTGLKASDFK